MRNLLPLPVALGAVALAGALAVPGCSRPGGPAPATDAPAATEAAAHAATFEEARALAAGRSVPLLVDFYSPT